MSSVSSFVTGFSQLTLIWKLFGLYPYVMSNTEIKFSPIWFSVTFLICSLLILAEYYFVCAFRFNFLINTFFFGYIFSLTCLLIYCFVKLRGKCAILNEMITDIERIHILLSQNNFLGKEKLSPFRSILTILFFLVLVIFNIYYEKNIYSKLLHLAYYYVITVWHACVLQISDMLYLIQFYFKYIRCAIESLDNRLFYKTEQLYVLVESFSQMCTISINFDEHFGFQCLLIVTAIFISVLINIYHFLTHVFSGRSALTFEFIIIRIIWSWQIVNLLRQLVNPCVSITEDSRKFNNLLYQMMINDKTNYISNNERLRLHISMKREVVFSAYGFFALDYTLIHSMLAAGTTYIVILIQFGHHFVSVSSPTESSFLPSDTNVTELPTVHTTFL